MKCRECGRDLKVIHGGPKIVDGKIVAIHVWACLNADCELCKKEQNRTQTDVEQFNE